MVDETVIQRKYMAIKDSLNERSRRLWAAAESLPAILAERHHKTIPINAETLRRGADFVLCQP